MAGTRTIAEIKKANNRITSVMCTSSAMTKNPLALSIHIKRKIETKWLTVENLVCREDEWGRPVWAAPRFQGSGCDQAHSAAVPEHESSRIQVGFTGEVQGSGRTGKFSGSAVDNRFV